MERAEILVLGMLAPEVRAALAAQYELVEAGAAAGDLSRFRARCDEQYFRRRRGDDGVVATIGGAGLHGCWPRQD